MIGAWILILTLASDGASRGTAITSVGPFQSREACLRAGDVWLRHTNVNSFFTKRAVCVLQE